MMSAARDPLEEYLSTTYRPDREFIDGIVVERKSGGDDHDNVRSALIHEFVALRWKHSLQVFPSLRTRVSPHRIRIPDLCIVVGDKPREQVSTTPPLLCAEVLSNDDAMDSMLERIEDYLNFGVRYVWVLSPRLRRAWVYTSEGAEEARNGFLRTHDPALEIALKELFAG